ncbi:hypothetical protein N7G274_009353 [Stereocaulon virgatum]|uniref:Uncharacterized protein n=1 Tax=Stereocaulon virgatum TaxID=373712 RepID=A0ABR3ZYN8_9LECA
MALVVNSQACSSYQGQIAYALKLYTKTPHNDALHDKTIGSVVAFLRGGLGSKPIPYHDLVTALQSSHPALYNAVANDSAYWELEARNVYRRWMDMNSQAVQRINARGEIGQYLGSPMWDEYN